MKVTFIAIISAAALVCGACSKIEMARAAEQKDRDAAMIVQRYKQASLPEVVPVLNDYLAIADTYEQRGWAKYGPPGWIEYLRALSEGRLAIFYKATDKQDLYGLHMDRAVAHLKRRSGRVEGNDEEAAARFEEFINGLDKNLDPNWRKELAQPHHSADGSQPFISGTIRESSAAGSHR